MKWLIFVMILLMNYYVWTTVFSAQQVYAEYTLESIVIYFIGASFLYNVVLIHRQEQIGRDIVEGTLSTFLVQPMSYPWFMLSRAMVSRIVYTTIGGVVISIISFFIHPAFAPTLPAVVFTVLALTLSVIIFSCIDYLLGIMSFWLSRSYGLRWMFSTVVMLASGIAFPIDLLPAWLGRFLFATPFPYLIFYPLHVFLDQSKRWLLPSGMFIALFWSVILVTITVLIWKRGIRHFDGAGI